MLLRCLVINLLLYKGKGWISYQEFKDSLKFENVSHQSFLLRFVNRIVRKKMILLRFH